MGKRYYDNYDYEEAYKEQCKKLEEAEMERWMKEGWVNCLYRTSTYKSTNTESNTTLLESMVYPSFKFKADMPKTEKKRETSPSQSNLNDKNARRYLIRLANINFGKGDIWATFGWNNGLLPETYEDAKKDVVNFIRRINRKRKKLGLENAKYIYNFSNNIPGYNELRNVLFPELQAALTGQKTAQEALNSYVEKGNVIIDEGRANSVIYN